MKPKSIDMFFKKLFLSLIAGYFIIVLPVQAQEATATLEDKDKPLKVYGDSVKFTANIKIEPHSIFNKEGYLRLLPELGDVKFKEIHVPSAQLENARKNGVNVTVTGSALFVEDMIGNDLEIESEWVYKDGKKNKEFNDMDNLAECCVTLGTLFSLNGQYELMNFEYTPPKSTPLKVVAQINFPLDIAKFPPTEAQDKVKVIGDYLKAHGDATITIRGYASPEGPVDRNKTLAEKRAQAAKDWLVAALDKQGYKSAYNKNAIKVESTTEDWKGFEQLVRSSDMQQEKKTKILEAVSTTSDMKETEKKLYEIVGNYDSVKNLMRPLRRATIVVSSKNAFREGYSTEDIDAINTQLNEGDIPASAYKDIFSQEEYLQAYVQNDENQGKITILTGYNKVYPGDMRVYSDLGALSAVDMQALDMIGGDDALVGIGFDREMVDIDTEIDVDKDKFKYKYKFKPEDVDADKFKLKVKADLKEMEKVKGYFVKAVEADNKNFVALNNLGAWYLTMGEFKAAEEYLTKSYKLDPSQQGANYNLGVLYGKKGDIEKAVEHFEKAGDVSVIGYNRGIARYLSGDYKGALEDFVNFSKMYPQYAIGHYLASAAAAQSGDKEAMIEHMRNAVTINKKLADVAAEDLAFQAYWDDADFEDAADDDLADN